MYWAAIVSYIFVRCWDHLTKVSDVAVRRLDSVGEKPNTTRAIRQIVSSFLASVTALGSIGSAYDASGAATAAKKAADAAGKQVEIAQDALLTSDRPWVDLDVSPNALSVNANQISATFSVTYTNFGRSPAQQVGVALRVALMEFPSPSPAKEVCDAAEAHPSLMIGNAVFPGTSPTLSIQTGVPMRDVTDYASREYNAIAGAWEKAFPRDIDASYRKLFRSWSFLLTFKVVGCVSYFIYGSPRVHQTAFVYDLFRIDPSKPDQHLPFDAQSVGDVAKPALRMERNFYGSFAN